MIDWVSTLVRLPHSVPINGGNVVSLDSDGIEQWRIEKRMQIEGSYSSSVQIRSEHKEHFCSHIRLDGNLVKFMQGHNVWGTCDLHGLITASLLKILAQVSPEIPTNLLPIYVSMARLTRLDLTAMYDLDNCQRVMSWLRAASDSASMKYRGRGHFSGTTLYWGKHSRRWSLKMYPKGEELKAHAPKKFISDHPNNLQSVTNFADRALRVELVLRGMELDRLGLSEVQHWHESDIERVYSSYLSGLEFSQNMKASVTIKGLEKLPPRLRACALAWFEGHDLRELYPRASWYRYRKEIFKFIGLDISLPSPKQLTDATSNVIPLFTVIDAEPMRIPSWAFGTPLYFEPQVYSRVLAVV